MRQLLANTQKLFPIVYLFTQQSCIVDIFSVT